MKGMLLAVTLSVLCSQAEATSAFDQPPNPADGSLVRGVVLFDFDNAPIHTALPLDVTVSGLTAHLSATGQGYSIQPANSMGFTPLGFSGLCIYPSSISPADLLVGFSQVLTDFSIMYAPQELGCDDSATMRVTAYMNGVYVGTNTATAPNPGTWPTGTLTFNSSQGFNSVVVHYDSRPPTCQDWGPIFMADNMLVTTTTNSTPDGDAGPRTLALAASPNPFAGEADVRFSVVCTGPVLVTVHDLQGRLVRTMAAGTVFDSGVHTLRWDGRNDDGREAASGVYLCRVQTGERSASTRMVLLRPR